MGSVRIYQKKEIRLDRLNVKQHQMFNRSSRSCFFCPTRTDGMVTSVLP
jgi:hypothetical protein